MNISEVKKLVGTKINDWEILEYLGHKKYNHYLLVKCVCGKTAERRSDHIVSGKSKSCASCSAKRSKNGTMIKCSNPECENTLYRTKTQITRNVTGEFYCCKKCAGSDKSNKTQLNKNKICLNCDNQFHVGPKSKKLYCSRECWAEYIKSNGPVYYRKLRDSKCYGCDFIPIDVCQLDVHHIDKCNKNNSPENLVTLCANCHRLITKINNQRKKNGLEYLTKEEILNYRNQNGRAKETQNPN